MKKKTKTIGILFTGIALAIGVAISSGVIRNSFVADETRAASSTANLVTNVTQLAAGDHIVIANIGGNKALAVTQNSNNRASESVSLNGTSLAFDDTKVETITLGITETKWTFYANKTPGYLYAASSSSNHLKTQATNDANGQWTISINSNSEATIIAQGTNTRNNLQYNANNVPTLFSCYSTGQELVKLYKVGNPITLESISVSGTLSKTSYFAGDSFESTGLTITATYSDSSTVNVTSQCSFTPNPLTSGTTSVTASYTEGGVTKTAVINGLTVTTRVLQSIEVTTNPTKVNYVIGESFNPAGMVITATYDVGSPMVGYTNYSYTPLGALNTSGANTITITSLENASISTSLQVQVSAVSSITIVADDIGYSGSGYKTCTFTKSGVSFTMANVIKNGSNIQFRDGEFSMHNSTALPGSIIGITTNRAGGTPTSMTLYTGTSSQQGVTSGGTADAYDEPSTSFSWEVSRSLSHSYFRLFNFAGSGTLTFSNIVIELYQEPEANDDAIAYGTSFLSDTAAGCSALDQGQLASVWSGLETSFNALSSEAKNYLKTLTPSVSGNDAQRAVARYVYIITKYGEATFNDYMNLDIQGAPSAFGIISENKDIIPFIAVIGIAGITVLLGFYYLQKKKEA
ncbi:MAG: bacterial Ig-like domain-containing protein [Bacilli bacterium]|jgi:hypothetical protein